MTAHKYYKNGLVTAEQFDENDWLQKYRACKSPEEWQKMAGPLSLDRYRGEFLIVTLEGDIAIRDGDWIATGFNGEHWPIADDIFKKTYQTLPVIPQAVGRLIKAQKEHHLPLSNVLGIAHALGITRTVSNSATLSWIAGHEDEFALAWLLGDWEVEDGCSD